MTFLVSEIASFVDTFRVALWPNDFVPNICSFFRVTFEHNEFERNI